MHEDFTSRACRHPLTDLPVVMGASGGKLFAGTEVEEGKA